MKSTTILLVRVSCALLVQKGGKKNCGIKFLLSKFCGLSSQFLFKRNLRNGIRNGKRVVMMMAKN